MGLPPDIMDDKEDIFGYDFIRQLALSPKLLFGSSYNARFIDCLPLETLGRNLDVIVLDTSCVIGSLQMVSSFRNTVQQGTPLATPLSVLEELAIAPQVKKYLISPEQERGMSKQRRDLLLTIAATGLLFDFKDHHHTSEYRLIEELGQCTSKAFATRILKRDLEKWDGYLANAVKGHPSYNQLFAWESASHLAKEEIFNAIMNAILSGYSIGETETRSLKGIERPVIATGAIASALNFSKSRMVRNISKELSDILKRNDEYKLDDDPSTVVASYGVGQWMAGCKRYAAKIIGGRLNRIIDAEVQKKPVEPYTVRSVTTTADTESLLLAYLLAENNPKTPLFHAYNDRTRAMPSFDLSPEERIRQGFPFYWDSVSLGRSPRVGFATRDADHFEALHLLQHIFRK